MTERPETPHFPWISAAYRHINATRDADVLDFSYAGLFPRNRWNVPGQPTLYLAGDIGVAISEWGRQFPSSYPDGAIQPVQREMFRLHLRLDAVVDLRATAALRTLRDATGMDDFRDVNVARAVATSVRVQSRIQAMLVPSIAFLDDLTRWNLVVFLEKLPRDTAGWITRSTMSARSPGSRQRQHHNHDPVTRATIQ